jgi:hypothetical protein
MVENREPMRITLFRSDGATRIHIDAGITDGGDLQVAGQDIGEAPKKWWGHDDYEYIVTIRKQDKDRLLLALIVAQFGDDASAVSRFREFAQEHDIPHDWFTWP